MRGFASGGLLLGCCLVVVVAGLPATAVAQAEPQTGLCDLPLAVPAESDVSLELRQAARGLGVTVTWPQLPDSVSTCVGLIGADSLDVTIEIAGGYEDDFDRRLNFQFRNTGAIGTQATNRLVVAWSNGNPSRTGSFGGEINLSNSGGLWRFDVADSMWAQVNDNAGLPRYFSYMNFDAFATGPGGVRLAGISSASQPRINPRGLFRADDGGEWQRIATSTFDNQRAITLIAFHPTDAAQFAVGTQASGLFLTRDGGQSFVQLRSELAPSAPQPTQYNVTALNWTANRLYVAVSGFGLFSSTDDGQTFTRHENLWVWNNLSLYNPNQPYEEQTDPNIRRQVPRVNDLVEDPADPAQHWYASLNNHWIFETTDGGQTWTPLYGFELDDIPNSWQRSVLTTLPDADGQGRLVMGTSNFGLWFSDDDGATWELAASPFGDPREEDAPIQPPIRAFIKDPTGTLVALADGHGLVVSDDGGATWADGPPSLQLANSQALFLAEAEDGSLLLPTYGGGIYRPGLEIPISGTILPSISDPAYLGLQLGLSLIFSEGTVETDESFALNAQDFQGWIVWRAESDNPDDMVMIGRYDKNNPESCIQGFCGDDNFIQLPNCFSERRASCFDFSVPGQIMFFDGDVYNGFTYYYAVTTYDYGDVSMVVNPVSLATPLIYPPRYPGDPEGVDEGNGNRQVLQVNEVAQPDVDGEQIYVYPNPLRRAAGIVGAEGEQVVWTNLPDGSRIQVFTLAGDKVADLDPEGQIEGNMYWITRNDDGQLLASGVYIWKCIMPARGDYWGKLVIIR